MSPIHTEQGRKNIKTCINCSCATSYKFHCPVPLSPSRSPSEALTGLSLLLPLLRLSVCWDCRQKQMSPKGHNTLCPLALSHVLQGSSNPEIQDTLKTVAQTMVLPSLHSCLNLRTWDEGRSAHRTCTPTSSPPALLLLWPGDKLSKEEREAWCIWSSKKTIQKPRARKETHPLSAQKG